MTSRVAPLPHMLRHWREAVPDDRLAHLIRDVSRAQMRSLHVRLTAHGVSFGHWTFLRILWLQDGLTQRELSHLAGVMEPTTLTAVTRLEPLSPPPQAASATEAGSVSIYNANGDHQKDITVGIRGKILAHMNGN